MQRGIQDGVGSPPPLVRKSQKSRTLQRHSGQSTRVYQKVGRVPSATIDTASAAHSPKCRTGDREDAPAPNSANAKPPTHSKSNQYRFHHLPAPVTSRAQIYPPHQAHSRNIYMEKRNHFGRRIFQRLSLRE